MTTLLDIAKVESNGKVKLTPKSFAPQIDGYDLTLQQNNWPYHAHPEATPEIWALVVLALAADPPITEIEEYIAPPPDTANSLVLQSEYAIQQKLDEGARTWGYDSIISASTYVNSSVEKFKHESISLLDWRDQVWVWANQVFANISAGKVQAPSSIEVLVAEMPKLPTRPT